MHRFVLGVFFASAIAVAATTYGCSDDQAEAPPELGAALPPMAAPPLLSAPEPPLPAQLCQAPAQASIDVRLPHENVLALAKTSTAPPIPARILAAAIAGQS